jgi:hypothetical protein
MARDYDAAEMTKQRLKRRGATVLEWILRTLQEIANSLGSLGD